MLASGGDTILPMQEIAIQMARVTPRRELRRGADEFVGRAQGSLAAAVFFGILTVVLGVSGVANLGSGTGVLFIVLALVSFTATRFAMKSRAHNKSMANLGMLAVAARDVYEVGGEPALAELLAESRRRSGI